MPETDHARYISLLTNLYSGATLSDSEHIELTNLHFANIARVGKITTEGAAP